MPFRFGKTLFDDELPQAWDLNFLAVRPGPGCAAGPFAPVRERIAVGERRRPVVVLHQIDAELRVERGDELLELHSDVDRPFALWQTQRGVPQRLDPNFVYGPESGEPGLNSNVEPWSTGHSFDQFGIEHFTRPWYAPESQGAPVAYVTDFPGQGPIGRLVYRADDGHVWELFYDHATVGPGVSGWGSAYLTTLAGGAPASATPVAYVTDFPGQGPIVWGDAPIDVIHEEAGLGQGHGLRGVGRLAALTVAGPAFAEPSKTPPTEKKGCTVQLQRPGAGQSIVYPDGYKFSVYAQNDRKTHTYTCNDGKWTETVSLTAGPARWCNVAILGTAGGTLQAVQLR